MTLKVAQRKEKSLSTLISELDKLVSEVVRRSAADDRGYCHCVSCGQGFYWKEMDCAHFIDRSNMATRFNLINLGPACRSCNRYNEDFHLDAWSRQMGQELVDYLEREGRSMRKLMRYELEKGIELMQEKLKTLR